MAPTTTRWAAAFALAFAVALSPFAQAFGPGGDRGFTEGRLLAYLADELGLSEAQVADIEALQLASKEATAIDRARMGELQESLRAQHDNFDAGATQVLADEAGEITTRLIYAQTSTRAKVLAVLTEQQREQLAELREERPRQHRPVRDRADFQLN